jgi:hypothetical protein
MGAVVQDYNAVDYYWSNHRGHCAPLKASKLSSEVHQASLAGSKGTKKAQWSIRGSVRTPAKKGQPPKPVQIFNHMITRR